MIVSRSPNSVIRIGLLVMVSLGVCKGVALARSETTLYVDGHARADGATGAVDHPFPTIRQCASAAQPGVTCLIRGGIYDEMLVPPQDGVTFEGAPREEVVISTADPIGGWYDLGKGVFAADLVLTHPIPSAHAGQAWPGDAMFDGRREVPQAQWPAPSKDKMRPRWATIASVPVPDMIDGKAQPQASIADPAMPKFSSVGRGATIHIWSGPGPFAEYEGTVLDAPGGRVTYAPLGAFESNFAKPGGFYYVVGSPDLISDDTWAYDGAAHRLLWKPPAGVDPKQREIRFTQRPTAVDLSGRSHITLRHITLFGGGVVMDKSSAHNRLDDLKAFNLSATQRPHALAPAVNGDLFNFGILLDGEDESLTNSTVAYTSQNGITLHGRNSRVDNVLVHDVDTFGDGAAGIAIGDRDADVIRPRVTHTTIYRSGGADIAVSANSRGDTALRPSTVREMEISFNNLFGAMWLRVDGGVIYACCRNVTTGSRIHDNWIHNGVESQNTAMPAGQGAFYPHAGLYWDNGMGGLEVDNNILWDSFPEIFIHGNSSVDQPTLDVHVKGNATPDPASECHIMVTAIASASDVEVAHNRILFAPRLVNKANTGILVRDNGLDQADVIISDAIGCKLDGCTADRHPPPFPPGKQAAIRPPLCNRPAPPAATK